MEVIFYVLMGFFSLFFLAIITAGAVFLAVQWKKISFQEGKAFKDYRLAIKRLKSSKGSSHSVEQIDDDANYADFEDALPDWLNAVLEGAGISLPAFYEGDPEELKKLQKMINNIPGLSQQNIGKSEESGLI